MQIIVRIIITIGLLYLTFDVIKQKLKYADATPTTAVIEAVDTKETCTSLVVTYCKSGSFVKLTYTDSNGEKQTASDVQYSYDSIIRRKRLNMEPPKVGLSLPVMVVKNKPWLTRPEKHHKFEQRVFWLEITVLLICLVVGIAYLRRSLRR
jgi:hypothetical protein